MFLSPIWWIYDNTVNGNEDKGYKFFAFIMAVIIGGGAILLFVLPALLSATP
jgi:hypothetical protein